MDERRDSRPDEDFDMPEFDDEIDANEEDRPLTPEEMQEAVRRYKAWLRAHRPNRRRPEPMFDDEYRFRRGDTVPFPHFGRHGEPMPPWGRSMTTNRYIIRGDGFCRTDNVNRMRLLAYAVWGVGVIGALLTAALTCAGLLTCFWILAGAGVLGALIYLLCEPVQHLAQIAGSLQSMSVEQVEFADDDEHRS